MNTEQDNAPKDPRTILADGISRIKPEEIVRPKMEKAHAAPPRKSWWDYLNSQFALWFLSSIILGLVTFVWNYWNGKRLEQQKTQQETLDSQREDSQFLAALLPYLTSSDASVRLRATVAAQDIILARYPRDKVPQQIQLFIANSIYRETSVPGVFQTEELKRLLENVNATFARVQMLAANDEVTKVLAAAQDANERQQVIVSYYSKSADDGEFNKYSTEAYPDFQTYLQDRLTDAGFEFRQPSSARNQQFATNAIWVADDVSINQAKFVALVLMQGGLQIRALRRLAGGASRKSHTIEIGSDAALNNVNGPPLTAKQVGDLTDLPKR
jgi:hypothetical protein